MHCEICGAKVTGTPIKIEMDGSELDVCSRCVKYGTVTREVHVPHKSIRTTDTPHFKKIEIEAIDPDYGQKIRKAREKAGLTQEKLAQKINEKMSLIGKIERYEMVPDDTVRKKLERLLNITLIDRLDDQDFKPSKTSKGVTLGDIALIKKERK